MNSPTMQPSEAPEREALHAAIGNALANLIGAPDERRHLTDTLAFVKDRLECMSLVTQIRVLQLEMSLAAQELAHLERFNTTTN